MAQRGWRAGLVRTAALPTAVTASLLFFCTAATPGANTGQNPGDLDTVTAPLRPGDWPMPDLIRNT
ncbi:hypothetical protein, partial [Parafrankia sp. FMc2]|uniref:hypothetical protein n=1 Tax=Parafrankia sp. FMc2 TaxID=3233196 RepID=UPI0034D72773